MNPGEIPGNAVDDDGNGYVDDVYGWDFYNRDNNPMDDHGHGTHTAGTIAAAGNNGSGVVGVTWGAKIMALKFLNSWGIGFVGCRRLGAAICRRHGRPAFVRTAGARPGFHRRWMTRSKYRT